eukprot:scaffold169395_cov13-Tisochrysis_lutea.AAC.1
MRTPHSECLLPATSRTGLLRVVSSLVLNKGKWGRSTRDDLQRGLSEETLRDALILLNSSPHPSQREFSGQNSQDD